MDDAWRNWFAGFCDGEACFRIYETGSPTFALNLREDDHAILSDIRDVLGVGSLSTHSNQLRRSRGGNAMDNVRLSIHGPNCGIVADALRGRMRSKKARDFEIWDKAVQLTVKRVGRYHSAENRKLMQQYRLELQAIKRGNGEAPVNSIGASNGDTAGQPARKTHRAGT